jgi:hypothetical protein
MDWEGRSNIMATMFTGHYPSGLYLWGYVKDKVYSTPVPDTDILKARVRDALATVAEEMLEKTWREIEYRLDVLRATKGAYVAVYYCSTKNFVK